MMNKEYLYCWGKNEEGQMGARINSEYNFINPSLFTLSFASPVKKICCGENHTIILTKEGYVYSSGANEYAQLGRTGTQRTFGQVHSLEAKFIIDICCGKNSTLVLDNEGSVFGFGNNDKGQLGCELNDKTISSPKRIMALPKDIIYISAGYDSSFAISKSGDVYSWGSNFCSQLGYISSNTASFKPKIILSFNGIPISQIQCGLNHSVALSSNGIVYSWGSNSHGQTGHMNIGVVESPKFVSQLKNYIIVNICCGQNHTIVLSNIGQIFTFGSGRNGQLGNGCVNNETSPCQILDLCGVDISFISSGREHTVVGSHRNYSLYTFGCSNFGQCGPKAAKTSQFCPVPITLPRAFDNDEISIPIFVKSVTCGADYCMMIFTSNNEYDPVRIRDTYPPRLALYLYDSDVDSYVNHDDVIKYICTESKNQKLILEKITFIFKSIACLNMSFLRKEKPVFNVNKHNINYSMVNEFRNKLMEMKSHKDAVSSLAKVLSSLGNYRPIHEEGYRFIYYIIILPICDILGDYDPFMNICEYIFNWGHDLTLLRIFVNLPPSCLVCFVKKIEIHLMDIFLPFHCHSKNYSKFISKENLIIKICKLLDSIYKMNEDFNVISYLSFYIDDIEKNLPIYDEYCRSLCGGSPVFNEIYHHPYIFNTGIKSKFVYSHSLFCAIQNLLPRNQIIDLNYTTLINLSNAYLPDCSFVIHIRRDHLVEDTLSQLVENHDKLLNKMIFVEFIGEVGFDQGGVRKEFFFLLIKQIFSLEYGLFTLNKESQYVWFPERTFYKDDVYFLLGLIISLATFNAIILDLLFPLALYSKLLNKKIGMSHLEEFDPILAKGFQFMLDYNEEDFEEVFPLTFQIERMYLDEIIRIDLIPNGANTSVSLINKQKYVEYYIDYIFNRSCEGAYSSFEKGFYCFKINYYKQLFNPEELRELIIGHQDYDFIVLQQVTMYDNGYDNVHPVIRNFWKVVHSFDLEHKKKFLQFVTGTSNIPIQGMNTVKIKIVRMNVDANYLPVSHTCVNLLELPPYPDEASLREKLLKAIENCEGFGLV